MTTDTLDQAAEVFVAVRDRLFGIAFRILNNWSEAEDIVQDTWLRWQACDREAVQDPPAFLATTTKRLCINTLQSARARRETHFGPWLCDPADPNADPHSGVELREALEVAAAMLLEKLSATERAAYVLREAFDYSYPEIATIIYVTEANARQLVSRARKHLTAERRAVPNSAAQERLLGALAAAVRVGDLAMLENVFSADVALAA